MSDVHATAQAVWIPKCRSGEPTHGPMALPDRVAAWQLIAVGRIAVCNA
jgi:hypothetical protein